MLGILPGEGNETARGFLLKINSSGVEQWRRIIGPEGYNITTKQTGTDEELRGLGITASANNLITVGYRGTYPNYSAFMMKFDSSGD